MHGREIRRDEPDRWAITEVVRDRESWDLPPAWIRYTVASAIGLGIGSFLGCLAFQPWRRPVLVPSAGGAEAR
jgi:hypothetical protein